MLDAFREFLDISNILLVTLFVGDNFEKQQ